MDLQDYYQKAINFAGKHHADQIIPGSNTSYMVHLSNVAMEVLLANQHGPDSHGKDFDCEFRGEIEAKNRGKLKMYFVNGTKV